MANIGTITTKDAFGHLAISLRVHRSWKVRMAIGAFLVGCAARIIGTQCEVEIIDKREAGPVTEAVKDDEGHTVGFRINR